MKPTALLPSPGAADLPSAPVVVDEVSLFLEHAPASRVADSRSARAGYLRLGIEGPFGDQIGHVGEVIALGGVGFGGVARGLRPKVAVAQVPAVSKTFLSSSGASATPFRPTITSTTIV